MFGQGVGSCDAGSSAAVTFQDASGSSISNRGCIPLDGSTYVMDCPAVNKGTIAEGTYQFIIDLGPNIGIDSFSITHTQQTSTAATPTSYVTSTTYEGTVSTTTSTITNAATSDPVTVSTPISTRNEHNYHHACFDNLDNNPYTRYKNRLTVTQTVRTISAPCKTAKPSPCPIKKKANVRGRDVVPDANGYTVTGDGPLTITVTPAGVVSTQIVDGGTTTDTETAYATTTTTVLPTPGTTTVYPGPETAISYVTLATLTGYVTKRTATRTSVTRTFTLTWTRTQYTTPVCTRKP